jgi:hypothetical protein
VEHDRHIEVVERDVAIAAIVDMEEQGHVAEALGRSRGQRRGCRYQARTKDVAVAVLEIITGKMPCDLVCHRSLPLVRSI